MKTKSLFCIVCLSSAVALKSKAQNVSQTAELPEVSEVSDVSGVAQPSETPLQGEISTQSNTLGNLSQEAAPSFGATTPEVKAENVPVPNTPETLPDGSPKPAASSGNTALNSSGAIGGAAGGNAVGIPANAAPPNVSSPSVGSPNVASPQVGGVSSNLPNAALPNSTPANSKSESAGPEAQIKTESQPTNIKRNSSANSAMPSNTGVLVTPYTPNGAQNAPTNISSGGGSNAGGSNAQVNMSPEKSTIQAATPTSPENFQGKDLAEIAAAQQGKITEIPRSGIPEEYVVQPGDTLWDIADQLFDDPYLWSGIWNLNKQQLTDPNILAPGSKIALLPGLSNNGEKVNVKNTSLADASGTPAVTDSGELMVPDSLATALGIRFNPVAASWKGKENTFLELTEVPKEPNISFVESVPPSESALFMVPGFMSSSTPESVGDIVKLKSSHVASMQGTLAYAKFKDDPAIGKLYLAVRKLEAPSDPNGSQESIPMYSYTGVVGVKKIHQSGVAELFVESSDFGVMEGDFLIPHKKIMFQETLNANTTISSVNSRVVGVLNEGYKIAGVSNMVFLEQTGQLRKGMEIEVFMPPGGIAVFDETELDTKPIARVRIVEEGEEAVVALVLSQTAEIAVGAKTNSSPQE